VLVRWIPEPGDGYRRRTVAFASDVVARRVYERLNRNSRALLCSIVNDYGVADGALGQLAGTLFEQAGQ
jgi:hypothetical protein